MTSNDLKCHDFWLRKHPPKLTKKAKLGHFQQRLGQYWEDDQANQDDQLGGGDDDEDEAIAGDTLDVVDKLDVDVVDVDCLQK
jgi:hypothetical protein